MERWEDNLQELVLSFHHMGFGNWTKVIRLGSFLPAQPSHWLLDKYSWVSKEIKLGKQVEKRHESSKVHSSYSSSFHLQGEEAVRAAPMVGHSSLGPNFLLCSLPEEQDGMRQPTGGICDIPAPVTLCSCVLILCGVWLYVRVWSPEASVMWPYLCSPSFLLSLRQSFIESGASHWAPGILLSLSSQCWN